MQSQPLEILLDTSISFANAVDEAQQQGYGTGKHFEIVLNDAGVIWLTKTVSNINWHEISRLRRLLTLEELFIGTVIETTNTHEQIAYLENRITELATNKLPSSWCGTFETQQIRFDKMSKNCLREIPLQYTKDRGADNEQ